MGILFWEKCKMCSPHLSFSKILLNLGTVNSGPWHLTVCVWLWHMSPSSPCMTYPLVKDLHCQSSLLFSCTFYHLIDKYSDFPTNSVQFSCSVVSDSFRPLWAAAHQASLFITNSQNLLKLMSIESVMPSNHSSSVIPFFSCLQSFPTSGSFPMSQFFASGSQYWSFSFSISPSNEYSGLISFRMDWLDLVAVQRTLKSLLQHHSSKASILWCSAFFIVRLSHQYMTTGKNIALTIWTFVGIMMSLLLIGCLGFG